MLRIIKSESSPAQAKSSTSWFLSAWENAKFRASTTKYNFLTIVTLWVLNYNGVFVHHFPSGSSLLRGISSIQRAASPYLVSAPGLLPYKVAPELVRISFESVLAYASPEDFLIRPVVSWIPQGQGSGIYRHIWSIFASVIIHIEELLSPRPDISSVDAGHKARSANRTSFFRTFAH